MTRKLLSPIPIRHVEAQRRAADPDWSVWVSANAGSGKTHVLTERVLRLLLTGVAAESILCLTYTKAAAAVMRARIAERLANWALADETALEAELTRLSGHPPAEAVRRRARTLFARALDTPGGLKIVTIHAYCESVLHRFPLEAGVPFDFSVIEDADRADMILGARQAVMAAGLRGEGPCADAVETLFRLLSDTQIASAIDCALAEARRLRPLLRERDAAKARLRKLTGVAVGTDPARLYRAITAETVLHPGDCRLVVELFDGDGTKPNTKRFADLLARADLEAPSADDLLAAFLTRKGLKRANLVPPREQARHADLNSRLLREQDRIFDLHTRFRAAELVARSEAMVDLVGAILDRYDAEKRARSLLDFDDLIDRAGQLFADRALGPWVRYKLDAGITHVLVDESQDTNPEQWEVVRALTEEFFAGESAVATPRTLFAVGDEKQSIYSFQGADPALFGTLGRRYEKLAREARRAFLPVPMHVSFRTLQGLLKAVDKVFAGPLLREALLAPSEGVIHESARAEAGGTVTLWPPIQQPREVSEDTRWPLSISEIARTSERQVAERIADEITGWVQSGRPLGPRGRPVRFDDVMILVQSRGPFFQEIIRALGKAGIPTPGADQLSVSNHIGVRDLLALGDVLLNPAEDLQLAAVLRSPLFDVSEEDLLAIAHDRQGSLWQALERSGLESARNAFARLRQWRSALDFERPYEFYARVLYAEGGLERLHRRLGPETDDVMAEFLALALAHEQNRQPGLQGFIAAMRQRHISIRRELPEHGAGVRVMTVHGAKGLEAPIVVLADAATKPNGNQLSRPVLIAERDTGPILVHAGNEDQQIAETAGLFNEARAAQLREYWRKLYVGMTRAEDELYVTGALTPGKDATTQRQGTWYEAIQEALAPEAEQILAEDGTLRALVYPADRPQPAPPSAMAAAPVAPAAPFRPEALPAHTRREIVRPSSAYAGIERVFDSAAESLVDAEEARREGLALHALLQHLGRVPVADWPRVGIKAMPALLPDRPERHEAIFAKATSILRRPELAHLFGPDSRAELPFLVDAQRNGRPVRIAGRIDRLVVGGGRVLVVDYKSDANPPADPSGTPPAYRMQLAVYALVASQLFPDMIIEPAILWTALESLMILPASLLAEDLGDFTMR